MNETIDHSANIISNWTYNHLVAWGISKDWAEHINAVVLFLLSILLIIILQWVIKRVILPLFSKIANVSHLSFFGYLVKNNFPRLFALLIPYSLIDSLIPIIFSDFLHCIKPAEKIVEIGLIFLIISIIMSLIKSGADVLMEKPSFRIKPMNSYLQVIKMVLFLFGIVIAFSTLTGKSPAVFFATMGAASAILLLMFKDAIMGFVASIQITANDMVRIGDWITVPKYGADGDVIEINLTTVKVQNFDKTITALPTYALISDSFQNWRGMQSSGGRRIKRSISIKQSTIRYIREEELPEFRKIQGIAHYIDERQAKIDEHNKSIGADRSISVNGRNMTNAGLFRKYAEWYLRSHPGTKKDMTLMVRQLPPSEVGLPFELYAFTNTINWTEYENTMSDIFDHLIASVGYFDLQIFERESGGDIKNLKMNT